MSVKRNLFSRLTRTRLLFPLLLIVLLLPALYFYATRPKETAAWWNESWIYRKRIDISNPGGSDLTDFQISFTLDTTDTNKFQSNCEDLRITGVDGNLLPFWIEENNPGCGDANTKVWVKLPSIPSSGTYIYAYYGNPSASQSSEHDGNKVFEFFDDFSGTSLNTTKWQKTNGGTPVFSSGTLTITATINPGKLIALTAPQGDNYILRARFQATAGANGDGRAGVAIKTNTSDGRSYNYVLRDFINLNQIRFLDDNVAWGTSSYGSWLKNTYYTAEIYHNGTNVYGRTNDGTWNSQTWSGRTGYPALNFGSHSDTTTVWDFALVRKAATTEPTTSVQSEEIGPGPIAYWKFDEGTGTTAHDSAGNNHGAINGAVWKAEDSCVSGKCLLFDGTNDYINYGDINQLDFGTNSFSVSLWFKSSDVNVMAINKRSGPSTEGFDLLIGLGGVPGRVTGRISDGTNTIDTGATTWDSTNDTKWHHAVMVIDRESSKLKLYGDGTLKSEVSIAVLGSVSNSIPLQIGARNGATFYEGLVDEVKIFPYALTADQIKKEYNLGAAVVIGAGAYATPSARLNDSLVSHWSFDELSGQTAYDKVGNNHTTLGADTNPGSDDPTWKTASECKTNGCLEFDGSDDHTYKNSISPTLSSTLSICAYIKTSSTNKYILQLNRSPSNYFYEFILQINGYGKLQFWDYSNSNYGFNLNQSSNTAINDNTWKHICFVKSGTTGKYYINGQLDNQTTAASDITYGSNDFVIGKNYRDNSLYFSGLIDEVKIYSSALTPEQIRQDMNTGSTLAVSTTTSEAADLDDGEGNPPIAEWKFDEKTGSTANDTSGNNYTGTITGATWKSAKDCKIGACLNFNGTSSYIDGFSTPNMSAFTVVAWTKTTSTELINVVSGGNAGSYISISGGQVRWYDGNSWRVGTSNINDGEWHQVFYIFDNGAHYFGVDGKLEYNNDSGNGTYINGNINVIGAWSNKSIRFFNGLIDHVKIYDYARTPAQIAYDYNRGEPVAHWKMDECQGSTIHDSSDNGNHGTWNGSGGTQTSVGTCTTSGTAWGNGSTGKFGASLNFDGEDDYLVKTSPNNLPTKSEATWSWWSKTSNSSWLQAIIGEHRNQWSIRQSNNSVFLGINAEQLGPYSFTTDNNWSHYAITFKSGDTKFYKNGNLIQEASTSATSTVPSLATLYIGRRSTAPPNSYNFSGQLDDVRIYNYALSATQIKKVMNEGSALRFGD